MTWAEATRKGVDLGGKVAVLCSVLAGATMLGCFAYHQLQQNLCYRVTEQTESQFRCFCQDRSLHHKSFVRCNSYSFVTWQAVCIFTVSPFVTHSFIRTLSYTLASLECIRVSEHSMHIQYSDSNWKDTSRQNQKTVCASVMHSHLLATA